jgi:ABC-type phosphate/phosphonate transport system substrate-binding protein
LVVPAGISPDLEAQMRTVLFNMHTDSDGKEILGSLAIDRFVAARKTLYDSVQQLRVSWEENQ